MIGKEAPGAMTPNKALLRMTGGILVSWLLVAVLLFGTAGRLDWGLGWLFFGVWGGLKLVFILFLRLHDPALMVERATRHENTQPYERIILPLYFVLAFGTFLVAGLDGGRFRWSGEIWIGWIIAAYLVYLLGNGLASWAVYANPFFSSESRLQTERGQTVTRGGPYRFVRHPAYLASILLWVVTGVLLESWWAVIPGLLAAVMMLLRTIFEDRMLLSELSGYQEYVREVPFRLFPGFW